MSRYPEIEIKNIDQEQAASIIEKRIPLGLFCCLENSVYVGIDNSSGDAWTEKFSTEQDCLDWLNGKTTYEFCPHCMTEVEISSYRVSMCPNCDQEILPCSTCYDDFGDFQKCDWTEKHRCWRFPKNEYLW